MFQPYSGAGGQVSRGFFKIKSIHLPASHDGGPPLEYYYAVRPMKYSEMEDDSSTASKTISSASGHRLKFHPFEQQRLLGTLKAGLESKSIVTNIDPDSSRYINSKTGLLEKLSLIIYSF